MKSMPQELSRRSFAKLLASTYAFAFAPVPSLPAGPSMLLGAHDAYCGLSTLRARYRAGQRPPQDVAGDALSWLITGDVSFAERSLHAMRSTDPPAKPGTRTWLEIANWSLAFDWLYLYPKFDNGLKDKLTDYFVDVAGKMLALPDLATPKQTSLHNYSTRFLGLAAFTITAARRHRPHGARIAELQGQARAALRNMQEIANLIAPQGSYHESMDYMRIAYVPFAMLAELQRTTTGVDPVLTTGMLRSYATTYLYKLLPDGTPSREGDNEYPLMDTRDTVALGYAVHRFKDPHAAWLLRESGYTPSTWALPVLDFLWNDPAVKAENPAKGKLPQQHYFPGVDQLVLRNGFGPEGTRIEFDCGPYLAKHQHLDRGHFTIHHRGHLAIDSGADYTEAESPHYINYYRRTIAHNTMLVYDPAEKFFWSENVLAAANDGGQRMDSSRFWNTVRSLQDWERTKDIWDLAHLRTIACIDAEYHYALGDATRAYSAHKLSLFTRQLLYLPKQNILLVFDRVVAKDPAFRKCWLLHGVNMPELAGTAVMKEGAEIFSGATTSLFAEGGGEMRVHTLLPMQRTIARRGGAGNEFWTPGDARGGDWGSGQNWAMEPASGGAMPKDPELLAIWKTFYPDMTEIERSNDRDVVPGAWRIEVSPSEPAHEDQFLHVIEIGDRGHTGGITTEAVQGFGITGAAIRTKGGETALYLFPLESALEQGELTLPAYGVQALWIAGLLPGRRYGVEVAGGNMSEDAANAPGIPLASLSMQASEQGVAHIACKLPALGRLRLHLR